jgi:PAS domain S-box-containing protein
MRIRTKVLVGFTLLLGIVLAQGLIEYRHAISARDDLNLFEFSSLRKTVLANDLQTAVSRLEITLAQGAQANRIESGNTTISDFSVLMNQAIGATSAGVALARKNHNTDVVEAEESELRLLKELKDHLDSVARQWLVLGNPSLSTAQRTLLAGQALGHLQQEVKPRVQRYHDNSISELTEHSHAIRDRAERASLWFLGAALAAFAVAILARHWLVRTVMKPLDAAVGAANEITGGNLDRRLHVTGRDEFALLASAFNHMLDKLAATATDLEAVRILADARAVELDTFFNVSSDSLVIANHEGFYTRINKAFCTLSGYSAEELIRRPLVEFIHPDDRDSTRLESAKLFRGESSIDFENRHISRDGSIKWLSWHARPHLASGLLYAVGRDVTAERATKQALAESREELRQLNDRLEHLVTTRTHNLRESEERFRRLVDGVKDYAIYMLDVNGLIVSWNRGAERINGYAAADIIGGSFAKFYRPEDVANEKPSMALKIAATQGRFEETAWRLRNDGRDFLAHDVITAVRDDAGVLQGFATITRDITEQQKNINDLLQQQELMRLLLENLAEGVVACDATGKLTFFNKTARDWHGIDIMHVPESEWPASFTLCAADGTTPLAVSDMPLVRAERGERVRNAEIVIVRQDRAPRHIVASGDVLQDAAGKMVGAVMVMHDITERRNAERHHLRTQRLESIGTLSGGIAHDLNNALAPILMGIELLKSRYPDSQSFLNSMETSAKRGAGMVRQLLTFAKGVDGQRMTLQPRHLISEIESIIERTFPKNIELTVIYGDNLHPILGDATQIHQVLLNLCVNARDAMPDGGQLTIEAHNHTVDALYASGVPELKAGQHVRILISDTGTGMPPEVIERIFEPFFSTKSADKGTGLGLSTVIGIVRSHSGCVQVYSVPGEGTRFSVYLPVAEESSAISITPFVPEIDFAGDGRSILVVEDEPAVREIARAVLLSLDFKVLTANDGEDALLQLAAGSINLSLIITDLHMPKMDGLAFVKKARELAPDVPIIVSSGRLEKADADRLAEHGVRALLHKPFTQGDLVASLQHVFSCGSTAPFPSQPV